MPIATTSSPPKILLLIILAAARCCTGFRSRAGPSRAPLPRHGALPLPRDGPPRGANPPRRHGRNRSSRLLHQNAAGDDENDGGAQDDIAATEEVGGGGGGKKKEKKKKKKDEEERAGVTWEEMMSDPELRQIEFDSSIKRKNAMLLPQRISAAVTTLGWLFVGCGILLNQLGLAYVRDPTGGIRIGSLNERDFQAEVVRGGRRREAEAAKEEEEEEKKTSSRYPSISHHSGGGAKNARVLSWLEQGGMSWDDEYQGRMKKLHVRTTTIIHNDRYE